MANYKIMLKDPMSGDNLFPAACIGAIYNEDGSPWTPPVLNLPSGIIVAWSGSADNVPDGWHICDGTEGTPDLQGKFILGSSTDHTVGSTGGEETHALTTNEMPSHNHGFSGSSHTHSLSLSGLTTSSAGSHKHSIAGWKAVTNYWAQSGDGGYQVNAINISQKNETDTGGSHTHTISGSGSIGSASTSGTVQSTGGNQAHNNMPPYYALCYIMKL